MQCALTSLTNLVNHINTARRVELDSFVLRNPLVLYALETAAQRGADVTVRLGDPPQTSERAANIAAMKALTDAGAHVTAEPDYGPGALHAKIAIVDDDVYFDDRNFTSRQGETILVEHGAAESSQHASTKRTALDAEARLIREAKGDDIIVSTESLGPGPVVDALISRATSGDRVRLMYNSALHDYGRAETLERLRSAGVELRGSQENHKIAAVGTAAWIGSANATAGREETREWGRTVPADVAAKLRQTLEYCWWAAKSTSNAAHSLVYGHP